jgi:2',3'-cyclic-nucleotide 2'-phosphodiesterase (5'-nucleotidase family)
MKRSLFIVTLLVLGCAISTAQEYKWSAVDVDGSRTGCTAPSKDNISEAIGTFEGKTYVAPNGTRHKKSSAAAQTAQAVLEAQPKMARVKDVVAHSTGSWDKGYPESELSNWLIDIMIAKTEAVSGKKVHFGVTNFGGIRADMPQGEVILDDLLSMFPFKNYLVYLEHKGSTIRNIIEQMAAGRFQVLGGVRVVVQDGKVLSIEIGGEPLDDDKVYGVTTVSFLLKGGDGLFMAKDALSMTEYHDINVIDAVLEYVNAETAAGRPLQYKKDGRVTIIK